MKEIKRLVIFAGYDQDGIIDDYVVYFIKELKKIADIIYISNCYFDEKELKKISEYCLVMGCEPHRGTDWESYKRGFMYARLNKILNNYDYLILVNDSIYGPFYNLKTIVEKMELQNLDVWAMFYCFYDFANLSHLQAYFLSIKKEVFLSENFTYFMYSISKLESKFELIVKYELGLTKFFKEHNYKIGGYFDSSCIQTDMDCNLPFHKTEEIIKLGFPFLKRSILSSPATFSFNPDNLKNITNLIKDFYDIEMIKKNVERVLNIDFHSLLPKNKEIEKNKKNKEIEENKKNTYFSILTIYNHSLFSISNTHKYFEICFIFIKIKIKKRLRKIK